MKKTIIATTVAGALKIIVAKEGKKDRVLKTIQEVKGHLDAQSILIAGVETKEGNWTQIKKELLALFLSWFSPTPRSWRSFNFFC